MKQWIKVVTFKSGHRLFSCELSSDQKAFAFADDSGYDPLPEHTDDGVITPDLDKNLVLGIKDLACPVTGGGVVVLLAEDLSALLEVFDWDVDLDDDARAFVEMIHEVGLLQPRCLSSKWH